MSNSRFMGCPVFQALGTVSFLRDGECEAGDANRLSGAGARLYMKLLTPLIECTVEGMNLTFSFDTGASGTALFVRYYHLFRTGSKSSKRGKSRSFGAGGLVKRKIYIQPQVYLGVGDKTVTLKKVAMLSLVRALIPTTRGSRPGCGSQFRQVSPSISPGWPSGLGYR
jgi:hypothetical protein